MVVEGLWKCLFKIPVGVGSRPAGIAEVKFQTTHVKELFQAIEGLRFVGSVVPLTITQNSLVLDTLGKESPQV